MERRKKAKLLNAIEQIAIEQEIAVHDVISHLVGTVITQEDADNLLEFYNEQNA